MIRAIALAALLAAGSALAADADRSFSYSPAPRWQEEPETGEACAAVRRECPAFAKSDTIEADVGFDELYDASGSLAGLRITKSTGCKALDEYALLSHRHFKMAFHHDGQPDIDDIHLEAPSAADMNAVRIVKRGGTSMSIGCD